MRVYCPNQKCQFYKSNLKVSKSGTFFRKSDSRSIQRYKCNCCNKRFSSATFSLAYRQNKRRKNSEVYKLLSSGVSMRRIAKLLNIHYITVARKLEFLAKKSKLRHDQFLQRIQKLKLHSIMIDDLITIEHTKCKPLTVTVAVDANNRKIIGFEVSSIPAFGHLAEISRKKYGRRKNHKNRGIKRLLTKIQDTIDPFGIIISDEDKLYPPNIKNFFPNVTHKTYKGGKSSISGQGELKKLVYDPLFNINHTFAMVRANINRLFRRTWNTTKVPERLADHLAIYTDYHNQHLT